MLQSKIFGILFLYYIIVVCMNDHSSVIVDAEFQCPSINDACMNAKNYGKCQSLVEKRCKNINILESCPIQFSCNDLFFNDDDNGIGGGGTGNSNYECPLVNATCMNEGNYQKCIKLVNDGCQNIEEIESCPLKFMCNDDNNNNNPPSPLPQYDACATMSIYTNCSISNQQFLYNVTIPTWSQPGNDEFCYTNNTVFPNDSMNQQYCNPNNNKYYDSLYINSKTCDDANVPTPSVLTFFMRMIFTTGRCRRWERIGMKLNMCERLYPNGVDNNDRDDEATSITNRVMSSGTSCLNGVYVQCQFGSNCPNL